jgi:hypothetical protein
VADEFGPEEFDISAALPDAPDRLLQTAARGLADRFGAEMSRLYADNRDVFTALTAAGHLLPDELRVTAQLALARRLEADFVSLGSRVDRLTLSAARSVVEEAAEAGVDLDLPAVRAAAVAAVDTQTIRAAALGTAADVDAALAILDLVRLARLQLNLSRSQEAVYDALNDGGRRPSRRLARLGNALGLA